MTAPALQDRAYDRGSLFRLLRRIAAAVAYLARRLVAAQRNARERMQLAELEDEALEDVGLDRAGIRAMLKARPGCR